MDGTWTEDQYLKEPEQTNGSARFGYTVRLDAEGQTLLVSTGDRVYTYTREVVGYC